MLPRTAESLKLVKTGLRTESRLNGTLQLTGGLTVSAKTGPSQWKVERLLKTGGGRSDSAAR